MKIYPSLISSDVLALRDTLKAFNGVCEGYHIDVMDDHFVPNLTWGPMFVNAIANETSLPLQIHLMVDDPHAWVSRLKLQKKDSFIFHYEVVYDDDVATDLIREIKAANIRAGIAINPETKVEEVINLLPNLDDILLMSVNPGFSGQKFIDVTNKVKLIRDFKQKNNYLFQISIDGGINKDNIMMLQKTGVDIAGVASAIFSQKNYLNVFDELKSKLSDL